MPTFYILKTLECQLNNIFCLFLDLKNPGIALVTLNRGNICHVNIKRFKVWNQIFYFKYFPHLLLQLPTFDCGDIFSMLASIYLWLCYGELKQSSVIALTLLLSCLRYIFHIHISQHNPSCVEYFLCNISPELFLYLYLFHDAQCFQVLCNWIRKGKLK